MLRNTKNTKKKKNEVLKEIQKSNIKLFHHINIQKIKWSKKEKNLQETLN